MFNALTRLSNNLYNAGIALVQQAVRIQGIYLIGQWLSGTLYNAGSAIVGAAIYVNDFHSGLENWYNQLQQTAGVNPVLQSLIYWANRIIDFISNPYPTIISIVRGAFGYIEWMYYNGFDFIFPHVIRLLDTYLPWWRDIYHFVWARVGELFQDFNTLRYDPIRWVVDRLRAYSYNIGRFLSDPDGYIVEKIATHFPGLREFILDPSGYIIERLTDRLESFADRNMSRIVKIAENIISQIF